MSKFYAVKNGKKTGIFSTWDECKEQVTGFKGAVYKSFKTLSEAEAFLERNEEKIENIEEVDGVYAYIDGSFDRVSGIYGSGVVIVDGDEKYEYKHAGNREDYAQLHNVAGELEAAKFVMWYAVDKKIKEITLFYDYQGIEAWVVGDWKANLPYTQDYVKFYNKVKTAVKVNFVKVKAHTGIELNEVVDKLAKEAIEQFKKENTKFTILNKEILDREFSRKLVLDIRSKFPKVGISLYDTDNWNVDLVNKVIEREKKVVKVNYNLVDFNQYFNKNLKEVYKVSFIEDDIEVFRK